MTKKVFGLFVVFCMVITIMCNVSFAAVFQAGINAHDGKVGDTITVTVDLPANTGASGGSFNLVYDNTKMTLVNAEVGSVISGYTNNINTTYAENKIRCNFAGTTEVSSAGGTMLTAIFRLTSAGTADFSTEKFKLADAEANYLTCADVSKSITITSDSIGEAEAFTPIIQCTDGKVGDMITVTVDLPANTGASGGSFNLVYDNTKMTLVNAEVGSVISGYTNNINTTYAENKIRCNFAGTTEVSSAGGTMLTAIFRLTSAGTADFSTEKFKLADAEANYLTCADASKGITITGEAVGTPQPVNYPYTINSLSLKSTSGNVYDSVPNNSPFLVNVNFTKTQERDSEDYMFIAVYDTNGVLLSLSYAQANFVQTQDYNIGFYVPAQTKPIGSVKAYIWNSFTSAEPLAEAKDIK